MDYETFLRQGDPDFKWSLPEDEFGPIALNYTSGTTGNPKGVVTHHRGAYLNAMSQIISWGMPAHSVYLWTLPMFHCNGWCFPWTMAANAGTNVCLRRVDAKLIFEAIREHGVTHMCGAGIVYSMLINAPPALRDGTSINVNGYVGGAPPPASTIEGAERLGFALTHVYGLTETYGPASVCAKQDEWMALPLNERARLNARQGVAGPMQEAMTVMDPATMQPVPSDGDTVGEIMFRGNITMSGYLKNPTATEDAFAGGWFHTGDLGVIEPDGYLRITDRSKDVIISGGENISSVEVEDVLHRHPAVDSAAVVAKPDEKWGEVPCAFIELRPNAKSDRDRNSPILPRADGGFQGAQVRGVRSDREEFHRQGPEIQAARTREEPGDRIMTYIAPLDDMRFVLKHLAGLPEIATFPGFEEAEPELVEAILIEAARFAGEVLSPLNETGDRQGVRWTDGKVTTPDGFPAAYRQFIEAGWHGMPASPDLGGQGMPAVVSSAVAEMWKSSNLAFSLCQMLTMGAVAALAHHASDAIQQRYLPKMVAGEWTGTMNLTEPQAGSDLSTIRTRAEPDGDRYRLFGSKIFISWGEHDLAENVIHLVLARLPDGPPGTRGISLFVAPKFLVNPDGSLGARNDLRLFLSRT